MAPSSTGGSTAKKTASSTPDKAAEDTTSEQTEQPSGGSDEPLQVDGNAGTQNFAANGDAVVIKATGEIDSGLFTDAGETDKLVTVDKDVYEEFYFPGTTRPSHRLLYVAGQVVKQSDLDRINRSRAAAEKADGSEFPLDPTTIASGTKVDGPVVSSTAHE